MNEAKTTSVVAVLGADVVTTVAHVADEIAPVPSADVPLAIVEVRPPAAERLFAAAVATPVPGVVEQSAVPFDRSAHAACDNCPPEAFTAPESVPYPASTTSE